MYDDETELNAPGRLFRLDDIRYALGGQLLGRMREVDDDGAVFFQRELETQVAKHFEAKRPAHQFANGDLLPMRGTVPARDGEIGFYYMYDHAGIAKWHTSGGVDDIPRVSIKRWRQSFIVHRMILGWSEDLDDISRAQERDVPLQFADLRGVFDGLDRKLDNVLFEGDEEKALHGITNLPNITVLDAAAGALGAIRWTTLGATAKTFEEMVQDVDQIFETMRAITREVDDPNQIWMSTNYWARTASVFRGTTNLTVREHLQEKYPGVIFRSVRRLATAGQHGGPVLMGIKFESEEDLWAEVPGNKVPGMNKVENENISGYNKTYTGGVITPYPLRIVRQDYALAP